MASHFLTRIPFHELIFLQLYQLKLQPRNQSGAYICTCGTFILMVRNYIHHFTDVASSVEPIPCTPAPVQVLSPPPCKILSPGQSVVTFEELIGLRKTVFRKERIKKELGFTVNVGVGPNKLLAKMASELKKPDMVHTLWPDEIEEKMWPLPIRELFMVGHATEAKLKKINISTIGDLAKADPHHMKALLKSHVVLVWAYANGIDDSEICLNDSIIQKGIGNSTTIPYDVMTKEKANMVLLALSERVGRRLRKLRCMAGLVSVGVKTDSFFYYSHQLKLPSTINTTDEIYEYACLLFDQCWRGEPVRHLGVSVTDFTERDCRQISLFDKKNIKKTQDLDKTVDQIRAKYGTRIVTRATFVNGNVNPVQGGTNDSN